MFDKNLDMTMSQSQFHKVKLVTNNNKVITGRVDMYESEWDSGKNEPCIGIDIPGENLFYISNIKSLEIIDD